MFGKPGQGVGLTPLTTLATRLLRERRQFTFIRFNGNFPLRRRYYHMWNGVNKQMLCIFRAKYRKPENDNVVKGEGALADKCR